MKTTIIEIAAAAVLAAVVWACFYIIKSIITGAT
jgi:hypothetical protein